MYFSKSSYYSAAEHAAMLMGKVTQAGLEALIFLADWHQNHICCEFYTEETIRQMEIDTRKLVRLLMTQYSRDGHGWNLIKIHGLNHMPEAIRRGGHPREYSTRSKMPTSVCARSRSGHQTSVAMLGGSSTQHAMQCLPPALEGETHEYNTAAKRART
ncbi:hypothetical protein CLOP_g4733 [Closterium sp. NIES-67]|nr:hypothetical protein CLOP_g4733 [Closterium sp. NIES-67]